MRRYILRSNIILQTVEILYEQTQHQPHYVTPLCRSSQALSLCPATYSYSSNHPLDAFLPRGTITADRTEGRDNDCLEQRLVGDWAGPGVAVPGLGLFVAAGGELPEDSDAEKRMGFC